jgi:hypothetical protein
VPRTPSRDPETNLPSSDNTLRLPDLVGHRPLSAGPDCAIQFHAAARIYTVRPNSRIQLQPKPVPSSFGLVDFVLT